MFLNILFKKLNAEQARLWAIVKNNAHFLFCRIVSNQVMQTFLKYLPIAAIFFSVDDATVLITAPAITHTIIISLVN